MNLLSRSLRFLVLASLCVLPCSAVATHAAAPAAAPADHWVGTWATAPFGAKNAGGKFGAEGTDGTTLRQIVHLSLGGPALRVVFTNEFGLEPLTIGEASVAVRSSGNEVSKKTITPLTFGGRTSVIIPPGALVVSDAAALKVEPLSDLAVSFFLPTQPISQLSFHSVALTTNYLIAGDVVAKPGLGEAKTFASWDFLKGVDVKADADSGAIVTFGDSITDGVRSSTNKNLRWPDVLAQRLHDNKKTAKLGMLNEGIGGNRILHDNTGPSALARFDRDVLAQAGVKYLIILEAINDIGHAADPVKPYDIVSADDLIAGYRQMIARAHTHGIKVIGATLTPYIGAKYESDAGEAMRQAVNTWIRTTTELDGVADFDKATSDPSKPGVFLPSADGGDHLHPGDGGYKKMADSIDLKLFMQ